MKHSCIYRGKVRHRRFGDTPHAFSYSLFMMYLDLAELPGLFKGRWWWSAERPNLAWFRRADYLGPEEPSLDEAVRQRVFAKTGTRPVGPIRMLTHLRYLGYCFNPVTFYYCFDRQDKNVETIVAEITNTPWGERHAYVLGQPEEISANGTRRFAFAKDFHVSPFLPMDHDYTWYFGPPGQRLMVHMSNHQRDEKVFDVDLQMAREPITGGALNRVLLRYPAMTLTVLAGIYYQAMRLRLKKATYYEHPKNGPQYPGQPAERSSVWKGP